MLSKKDQSRIKYLEKKEKLTRKEKQELDHLKAIAKVIIVNKNARL